MKNSDLLKRIMIATCALVVSLFCLITPTYAITSIDMGKNTNLNIYYGDGETGFSNVPISVYRVADISKTGEYTLTEDYSQYAISLDNIDSSGLRALAQTLDAYTARDEINPVSSKMTNINGEMTINTLGTGLFLIRVAEHEMNDMIYRAEPMLVSLPVFTDGQWNYDVTISCKFEYDSKDDIITSRKVQKVWKDDGNREMRPNSITVQLLENGNVADTITLSQENNWEYTWNNLDNHSKWQVIELNVPDGYSVSITKEEVVFIITNTAPESPPSSELPQTGLLWWPVPILASCGLLFLIAGIIVGRKYDEK